MPWPAPDAGFFPFRIAMKKRDLIVLRACVPLGLGLALSVVACGGSDSGGDKPSGGGSGGGAATANGGSSASAGTSQATAGGNSKAGGTGTAGSGADPGGELDTGLPADKPITSLTDAEIEGLCDKFDAFYSTGKVGDGLKDFGCRFSGLLAAAFAGADTDAAAKAACKTAYDACAAAPSESTSTCGKPTATCTATVAEVEACANDSAKALEQLVSAFPSCTELTLADLMGSGEETMAPPDPASCTTLKMKCPGGPTPPSAM
jgi:hypothetical protein